MRLERVSIEGFRSYRQRTDIEISSLTAFIGENDVGKSSVLEALNAFFNDVVDPFDVNTRSEERTFTVGCVFSDLPQQINLDARSQTTLAEEYLLNVEGKLEIYKTWRATATKVEVERVFARALAPSHPIAKGLIFLKRDDLKAIVEEKGLNADKRKNPEMRNAIYNYLQSQQGFPLDLQEVDLDRPKNGEEELQDARKIWKKLRDRHIPVYSLFKAEQVRGDKESAVRSPLEATLKSSLKELEERLAEISEIVRKEVTDATSRTLDRLKRDYPDIAQTLVPSYKSPSWSKAFDLDVLRGDDDVPLNKRGTGVRRLVVLAFFQAEAEKKRKERAEGLKPPPVIYAVEEPEASQHPNFQRDIITALKGLSEAGDQVLVTTHVPGLAELLPIDSIRFIDRIPESTTPRVRSGANDRGVLLEAATSLGVFPSAIPTKNAEIAVWVEGDSDVWVLESVAAKLNDAGLIPDGLDINKIFYFFGGGGDQLKSFVNGEYLESLGLPQFYLRDSDKTEREHPGKALPPEVTSRVRRWKEERIGLPIEVAVTRKREIENYVHPDAIARIFEGKVDIVARMPGFDFDFGKMSEPNTDFWQEISRAKDELGFRFPSSIRRGVNLNHRKPKHMICGLFLNEVTVEEFRLRCATTDPEGAERSEIEEWFFAMAELVKAAVR